MSIALTETSRSVLTSLSAPIETRQIIRAAIDLCVSKAKSQGVALYEPAYNEAIYEMKLPELEFIQILVNLINNGIDSVAGQPEASVQLTCVWMDAGDGTPQYIFKVADSGPNIASNVGPEIMQPFFTTKNTGTGLGLSVAKKLAAACGGSLRLNPQTPNTCFEVVIPAPVI